MMKTLKNVFKKDKEKYHIPKIVRDLIPIKSVWKDGIFFSGNVYSKTFEFSDVNYASASKEDKTNLFFSYSDLLNSLDNESTVKITINNRRMNKKYFEDTVLLPMKNDGLDDFREEYNQVLLDKTSGANSIVQEKYITVSTHKTDIDEARAFFSHIGTELSSKFSVIGSKCVGMSAEEKIRMLHDFYRSGEEDNYCFDNFATGKFGHDFKDYICPDSIEKNSDYIMLGDKYARVLYLKDFATFIKDDFVEKLTSLDRNMMLSIDIIPVSTDEALKEIEKRMLGVEKNIADWQRRQNNNNNFSAVIPQQMTEQRKQLNELFDDMTNRDQRMFFALVTIIHIANSKTQLEQDTKTLKSIASGRHCQLATLKYQQFDGMNTALPIGTRKIDTMRTLITESLAVLMPFRVQEIQEKGGIYFGENAISKNLILCNMSNLLNQSMFVLGVPGSGKSFFVKLLILFLSLATDDDIIICDPENEYTSLINALGGSVINICAGGKHTINAMDMADGYGENNPVVEKAQFIMSLVDQIAPHGINSRQRSIIDRCVGKLYTSQKYRNKVVTLCDLREELLEQPEQEAHDLALSLEIFTKGSLDIFAHETNVDTNNRIISYNIRDLGKQLKPVGLLSITDAIINRVAENWKKGKKTHIIFDEFHIAYQNEESAIFFNSAWRQFRKRDANPCALTQNVSYVLSSVDASTMLANSEFVVMLKQSEQDSEELRNLLNISSEQMNYVNNVESGCGLMKYGNAIVPFTNYFPKDTKLYSLITTKGDEGFNGGNVT